MKKQPQKYYPRVDWNDERIKYLRENFPTKFNKDIAAVLGCGWRTVIRKAREMGLEKEPGFIEKKRPLIRLLQKGSHQRPNPHKGEKGWQVPGGEQYHFKKGDIPASARNPEVMAKIIATKQRKQRLRQPMLEQIRNNQ